MGRTKERRRADSEEHTAAERGNTRFHGQNRAACGIRSIRLGLLRCSAALVRVELSVELSLGRLPATTAAAATSATAATRTSRCAGTCCCCCTSTRSSTPRRRGSSGRHSITPQRTPRGAPSSRRVDAVEASLSSKCLEASEAALRREGHGVEHGGVEAGHHGHLRLHRLLLCGRLLLLRLLLLDDDGCAGHLPDELDVHGLAVHLRAVVVRHGLLGVGVTTERHRRSAHRLAVLRVVHHGGLDGPQLLEDLLPSQQQDRRGRGGMSAAVRR